MGKIKVDDKSCLKIRKRENMEIEILYINLHLKECLGMELTAL